MTKKKLHVVVWGTTYEEFINGTATYEDDGVVEDTSLISSYKYPITIKTITEACKEIDEYFIPMLDRVSSLVESGDNQNHQQKIINILKRNNGTLTRSMLSKLTRLGRKEMDNSLEVLENDSEEIKTRIIDNDIGRPITYISLTNKII
jgi:hypothetical protein